MPIVNEIMILPEIEKKLKGGDTEKLEKKRNEKC